MTIQEKIASLPHIDTIKSKIKSDVMYFRTDNPNIAIKVIINWERLDIREIAKKRQDLLESRDVINDETLQLSIMQDAVNRIQAEIDKLDQEHETWQ